MHYKDNNPVKFIFLSCSYCGKPLHLKPGTHRDNMIDASNKGHRIRGENHKNSKMTEEKVIELRELYRNRTMNLPQLAEKFGIKVSSVYNITSRITWKHV